MVKSCDVGSLPFNGDFQLLSKGASRYGQVIDESTVFFENQVLTSFLDKTRAGVDVPNYPQFRDMNQMMLDLIDGIRRIGGGYAETGALTVKQGKGFIQEVSAIRNLGRQIHERLGRPFELRVCIAGPYTLSSVLAYRDKSTFTRFGTVLTQIIEANIFSDKHGSVVLVSIDEPVFGFVDDPLLDRGSEGRENLLKAWESIAQKVRSNGAQSCLHLHNTSDELFWEVKSLGMIESHVADSFYQSKRNRDRLEASDKFLKASITITDFDQLIRNRLEATSKRETNNLTLNEQVGETWKNITEKRLDPNVFVENVEQMKKRLVDVAEFFGENRVPYAGPECGLKGFPSSGSAMECLKRVGKAVKSTN